uniref:Uncharacterized protein n=1 Tax=Amphimedon queenslandica TaxID=400682 RepID=A0A1X7TZ21_AMPQE
MASRQPEEINALLILDEVRTMEEFKVDTTVTKGVLSNIKMLMQLEGDDKKKLESFLLGIKNKIKELLLPTNFMKFHQNFHEFRSEILPNMLSELMDRQEIPNCCCDDYILWQCYIEKILEKELAVSKVSILAKPRVLTHVEQNAVRYVAGSVVRKLITKYRHNTIFKECLDALLFQKSDVTVDSQDSSEDWLKATDRGGLKYVTDLGFELFVEVEIFTYQQLSNKENVEEIHKLACKNEDILRVWSECVIDIEETEEMMQLLYDIVREWVKIRGHSMANYGIGRAQTKKM